MLIEDISRLATELGDRPGGRELRAALPFARKARPAPSTPRSSGDHNTSSSSSISEPFTIGPFDPEPPTAH